LLLRQINLSVAYASKREQQPTVDEYKLPAYTRLDAGAAVPLGNVEVQVNIKNVLNERITLSNGYGLVAPDVPRTFGVALHYKAGVCRSIHAGSMGFFKPPLPQNPHGTCDKHLKY
jgi:TonB dependent receptor